jgi:flavin-binding protein dodecin
MAVAKVIELISEGKSVEDAIENALLEAAKTVKNIKHVYAEGIQAIVENNTVKNYRINAKVTFIVIS